jgi:hypothetical protein
MPRKRANPIPRLLGSYAAPRCRIGRQLACRVNGDVEVDGITEAAIPWPFTRSRAGGVKRGGKPILILTGDLERAVKIESVAAVAYHWGVAHSTVHLWRQALGVGRMTAGSRRLLVEHAHAKLTKLAAKIPAIRAGIAAGKTNRQIGQELGLRWQSVWRIRTGATFAEEQST